MTDTKAAANDPVALLRQGNEAFLDVLSNVTPEQLELPTINDDWDVRALINHVVQGNQWSVDLLRSDDPPRPSGDAIGDRSPVEAFVESSQAMVAALEQPGELGRVVRLPFGEMPVAGYCVMRFSDTVSHAWDLAKATGQSTDIAPELCELALAAVRPRLDSMDRTHTPFKAEVPVPADACAADRLAGYLGKAVFQSGA
jgi:uncharacterized protein (TIGR03086 family)